MKSTFLRLIFIVGFSLSSTLLFAFPGEEYYKTGAQLYQQKNYEQAVKYFQAVLKQDPNNYQAYSYIGNSYIFLGKTNEAIDAYQKSIALHPSKTLQDYVARLKPQSAPAGLALPIADTNTSYVWDPTVDFYPKVTGPPQPLPKPEIPITSTIYLTADYEFGVATLSTGTAAPDFLGSYGDSHGIEIFSTKLNYRINPLLSITGGVEFWSIKPTTNDYSSDYTYKVISNSTETINVTPVFLGFDVHSEGKTFAFSGGAALAAFISRYEFSSNFDERPTYNYWTASDDIVQGFTPGIILNFSLEYKIDPGDHFGVYVTGKYYFAQPLSYSFGTANETFTESGTNNYNNYTFAGPSNSLGIDCVAAGFGVKAGF